MLKHDSQLNRTQHCGRCAFIMHSDSSSTGFRCGYSYFQAVPQERKPLKMDHYVQVQPLDTCGHWSDKANRALGH
jgi:hypothetical protein